MDASALLREVDTLFSDRSLSEEVRTKRLLEIKDAADILYILLVPQRNAKNLRVA